MGWQVLDAFVDAHGIRRGPPSTGQTSGGRHAKGSWHFVPPGGHARDYGMRDSDANAISRLFAPIAASHPQLIPEMFGSDGVGFDGGKPYQAGGHTGDHTHVAIGVGVTVEQLEAALAGADVNLAMTPIAATSGAGGGGAKGFTESGIRRFFLIAGGAGMTVWGFALLGLDLAGGARGVVGKVGIGRLLK